LGGKIIHRKLAPLVSPGKSWEGAIGGLIGVFVLAHVWIHLAQTYQWPGSSLFSHMMSHGIFLWTLSLIFLTAMSVVGDLVESLVKRSAGFKDSSNLLPGHGGVLDRLDALLPTLPIALMRKFPNFELIFSGGEGRLLPTGTTEAELAKMFYEEQGVDMKRVTLESKARNTRENARQVAALLGERCKQPWLLVTSAWHMPRSMSEFQAVGCNVTAYPVDFRTGEETSWTEYSMAGSLMAWQTALHEYLGMFVYGVTR
jgi:hypothetical protein